MTSFRPNPDDGNTDPGYNWCGGQAGNKGAEEFSPDILVDPSRSLLIQYLGQNAKVFKCPADTRTGVYQGTNPRSSARLFPPRARFP